MDKRIHIKFFTYQNNQLFLLGKSTITMNCQQYKIFQSTKLTIPYVPKTQVQFYIHSWSQQNDTNLFKELYMKSYKNKTKTFHMHDWLHNRWQIKGKNLQHEEIEVRNVSLHQQSQQWMMIHHMKMKIIMEQLL